jgi:alkylation response protein AidB-like acyl-CoA dehydrogenase
VPEEHGGAGLTVFDAMLVMEQCGRRLTGAGLLGHLGATFVLSRSELAGSLLPLLADGGRRAALVWADPADWTVEGTPSDERRAPLPELSDGRLSGSAGFQPDLAGADLLVVPYAGGGAALVEAASVSVEKVVRSDATRPLAHVRLEGAEASELGVDADVLAEAWHSGQALLAADALGVAEAVQEMATAYAKERHAFGRAIGSFQAVKHQIVEIMRHAGTARSLCYYAGLAAESRPDELALAANCARVAGEQAAAYGTRTCLAVHGGIGSTWEHDAPLYWRRAQLSRILLGGVAGAGEHVAEELIKQARQEVTTT